MNPSPDPKPIFTALIEAFTKLPPLLSFGGLVVVVGATLVWLTGQFSDLLLAVPLVVIVAFILYFVLERRFELDGERLKQQTELDKERLRQELEKQRLEIERLKVEQEGKLKQTRQEQKGQLTTSPAHTA